MKKILTLLFVFTLSINISTAANSDKDYTVNFNGEKFHLLYSVKNKDFGGYLNEYYKKGETYNIWTELVAVHHFPNAYSPIDRIKDFKDYLSSMHVPSSLTFDDKKNTAMIDFIMIADRHMPIVLEFNIFKYEKSKKCGSIAIQYTKRYAATTTMQIEEIKKDFEKNRKKLIKKVKDFEIPEIITKDIDKCISATDVQSSSSEEIATKTTDEIAKISSEENETKTAEIAEVSSEQNDNNNKSEDNTEEKNITTNNTTEETEIIEEAEKETETLEKEAAAEETVTEENEKNEENTTLINKAEENTESDNNNEIDNQKEIVAEENTSNTEQTDNASFLSAFA